MKLNKFFTLIGLTVIFAMPSCNDYEDVPIENFTKDYVFSTTDSLGVKAWGYLLEIYRQLHNGHNRIGGEYLDTASDDAVSAESNDTEVGRLQIGRYSAQNRVGQDMFWSSYYAAIRKANVFVKNIDLVPLKDKVNGTIPMTRVWKAEARFLRAYYYFELIKRYGGVPLIHGVYELGADMELPRNTFEDCVNFVTDELDVIQDSLRTYPIENPGSNAHVATREAALALKTRVLLYAASPLFNGESMNPSKPIFGYTEKDNNRWKKAADAARLFINTYGENGSQAFALTPDFRDVFLKYYDGNNYKEVIFYRSTHNNSADLERNSGPIGFSGDNLANGRNSPTQNLVDAFPMIDGTPISDNPNLTYENMYNNRDPRLGYTVLHNGSRWLSTTLQTYFGGASNPRDAAKKTKTSYYLCKFMGKYEDVGKYEDKLHEWVMFRYAEVLLNYAEAQNEYEGPNSGASFTPYDAIKAIRKRAGIQAGVDDMYGLKKNMTKDEMQQIIHNERRIELAFEEHRYWDIRRWKIAEKIFQKPLHGLLIVRNSGQFEYNLIPVCDTRFDTRRYLYPIPYPEVIKNKNMDQNPGWN